MLESLFNNVAGLQDCCKTYLLHALLRFCFSLAKTLKKVLLTFYKLLRNAECKIMLTDAYLEPN